VTRDYLTSELGGNQLLADHLLAKGSAIEVSIALPNDAAFGNSQETAVEGGLLVDAFVVLRETRPISLLLPFWK
jgi:hypothetical protein